MMILGGFGLQHPLQAQSGNTALRRIELAIQEHAVDLDLAGLGLTVIPPEIRYLTWLGSLNVSYNEFTELPPEILQLPRLQKFYLTNATVTSLPPKSAN